MLLTFYFFAVIISAIRKKGEYYMAQKKYKLPFGDAFQEVELPEEKVLQVITGNESPSLQNVHEATLQAIRHPIGSKPLAELLKKGDKVAIVVSDVTRAWAGTDKYLPAILEEVNGVGISDKDITIVIAVGTHRAHQAVDNEIMCGKDVCKRIKIECHDSKAKDLVLVGTTKRGTPVWLNHTVATADKVILTGGITVHFIAGFGGGRKSIIPGTVGYETTLHNHRQCMAEKVGDGISPLASTTTTTHNPLHEDMDDAAAIVNPCFMVNSVMTNTDTFARIVAGHWRDAWEEGCKEMMRITGVPARARADVVIASSGGYPRDINLYQGSKTFDTLRMALKPGGIAIISLECREMALTKEFNDFFHFDTILDMEKAVREDPSIPHIVALSIFDVAKKNTCYLVTKPENFALIRKTSLIPVTTVAEAWSLAQKELEKQGKKDYTINLMPQAATTVPMIK
jgi:nickel-dependent lactate racemase